MAIIAQRSLFSWDQIDAQSDLHRLKLVLEAIPDEELMRTLERERKGRRDRYPIRAVWNSLIAGVVFEHAGIEPLRRELARNRELLEVCGFDPVLGCAAVPPSYVYTRFGRKLRRHVNLIEKMFDDLVSELVDELPDFGERLAVDSKAVRTYARGRKEALESADPDADWGCKTYREKREDGSILERVKKWFGYKLHLLIESTYEIPIAYEVTRASANDGPVLDELVTGVDENNPTVLQRARFLAGDKAYDSADNNKVLLDTYSIRPVIPTRSMWKEEEAPGGMRQLRGDRIDNILYEEDGTVYCSCPESGEVRQMVYWGFEKERRCLKYRCSAAHYGIECAGTRHCCPSAYGRTVRISLDSKQTDRRIFVPVPRHTLQFEREYKKRTAVERVNSRVGKQLGFDVHFVRGMHKMRLKAGLAMVVMLSIAVAQAKRNRLEKMRTLLAA